MQKEKDHIAITTCPICKLNTAILLDYKKSTEKKLMYLCQACGSVFSKRNSIIPVENKKEN